MLNEITRKLAHARLDYLEGERKRLLSSTLLDDDKKKRVIALYEVADQLTKVIRTNYDNISELDVGIQSLAILTSVVSGLTNGDTFEEINKLMTLFRIIEPTNITIQ